MKLSAYQSCAAVEVVLWSIVPSFLFLSFFHFFFPFFSFFFSSFFSFFSLLSSPRFFRAEHGSDSPFTYVHRFCPIKSTPLSVPPSLRPSVHLPTLSSVRPLCPFVRPVSPSPRPIVYPSVRLSYLPMLGPSVRPSVCPYIRPSIRLSVRPAVILSSLLVS